MVEEGVLRVVMDEPWSGDGCLIFFVGLLIVHTREHVFFFWEGDGMTC